MKLIRTLLATKNGPLLCPKSICRVLVAVAEQVDDKLRSPAIETLCELAVFNPKLAFESGAIKLIFTLLVEGPRDLLDAIVLTVLYMLDLPNSREFIQPSVELEVRPAQSSCQNDYILLKLNLKCFCKDRSFLFYRCIC